MAATMAQATAVVPPTAKLRPLVGLLPFIRPYLGRIALASVFLLLAAGATLAFPAAVKLLVDGGLIAPVQAGVGLGERLLAVREHFLLLFAVAAALGLFTAARFYLVSWIGERVTTDLRQAVYAHVLKQSPEFFETLRTGEVLSRLTTDTTVVQTAVGSSISMGLRSGVMFLGGMGVLIATRPQLMLTVSAIIVGVVLPSLLISRRVRRLSKDSQDRIADTSGIAGEVLNAIPVVQSFTAENAEAARFSQANESAFATSIGRTRTRAALTAFLIIGVFGSLLYGMYGGVQAVLAGRMSAGELSQTALYIMLVASSVAVLAEVWGDLLRASGATERLMQLLAARSPITDPLQATAAPTGDHGLRVDVDKARFAYPSRMSTPVFDGLTLTVEAGTTVALVGPSGAGKTTLFQLLQRFYDLQAGAIRIDGVNIRAMNMADLRARIAVVPQDAVIFSGTILENIRYGRPAAGDDEVRAAAAAAHVTEFMQALPEGERTFVGERGLRLSGGQRQRVAIARAILKDAPLLLLDEATSALDAESERVVQAALEAAMRDRTTVVIAHRLATVQRAHRIYVFEQGRVVAAGTHAELMAEGGLYHRLAALQFAH